MGRNFIAALLLVFSVPAWTQVTSRTEALEAARDSKSARLEPDEPSRAEKVLTEIKDKRVLERIQSGFNGFRLKLGGLATGGGFALGPEYHREDLADGNLLFRTSAAFSFRNFQQYDLELYAPPRPYRPVFFQAYAVRHFYPSLHYYGPGPDSEKTGRTDYLYEDVALDVTLGAVMKRRFRAAVSGGHLFVNTSPGRDRRFASIEQNYSEGTTPGLDDQPNFSRIGGYVEFDGTDNRLGPRSGTYVLGSFNHHIDQERGLFTFDRLDIDFQQYVPLFNKRRVFAIRGKSQLTFADPGRAVPFYMQPVLGGSDDLRGFRPYRFYGNNLMVWNGEYRWEVFSGLDMALFLDAGKVVDRRSQINFHDLETAAGFGLRFNARNSVFMRIDVGFSHEGFQVWFKFNNIFAPKVIVSSSSQTVQ